MEFIDLVKVSWFELLKRALIFIANLTPLYRGPPCWPSLPTAVATKIKNGAIKMLILSHSNIIHHQL